MTHFARSSCIAASTLALVLTFSVASAQPPQPQQRLDLHSVLHIRPDQDAAWRTFQAGMTPPAGIVSELRSSGARMATMTTPQRLDVVSQNLQLQETLFHHQADAIRHFYAALTPDQQRIYDQVMAPRPPSGPPPQR